jgi:hypothetical protein
MTEPEATSQSAPDGAIGRLPIGSNDFERRIGAARRAKDAFFRDSQRSPLPHEQRRAFAGLAYFQPDQAYRFAGLRLERPGDPERARFAIDTSDHQPGTAYRLGRFRFAIGGQEVALTAYRIGNGTSDALFVPFRDGTSGIETYPAGRYLDITAEDDGTCVVDFNDAYHPFCAYSDSYSCPLPPAENWLPVRIEAGERLDRTPGPQPHG